MKITKFKKKKNDMYELVLENDSKITLHEDTILKNNLLITKCISDDLLTKLLNESNESHMYSVCIKYISYKMRSKSLLSSHPTQPPLPFLRYTCHGIPGLPFC